VPVKPFLKRTPLYPPLRAVREAFRTKSATELAERRDARSTAAILRRLIRPGDNGVDIGAHKGDILREFLRLSPTGSHVAAEPIPHLAEQLAVAFPTVAVHHAAASDTPGVLPFHVVTEAPAFSGLVPRLDLPPDAAVTRIEVPVVRLDDLVPADRPVRIIKIDVEGAELGVLRGATGLLSRWRPWVLFEHGSAAAAYGTRTADIVGELARHGLRVWHLGAWLEGKPPLSDEAFVAAVAAGDHWNFLAGPVN